MNPNDLRHRVRGAILTEIETAAWDRVALTDHAVQESLDAYVARWAKAKDISQLVSKYAGEA